MIHSPRLRYENNQLMREMWAPTRRTNPYFTKVFRSFAVAAHVLLNGQTIATITGTSTASNIL
jgi:hypothetical protein